MIDNWPILSIVTFMPLAGVLFLLMIKGDETTCSAELALCCLVGFWLYLSCITAIVYRF